LKHFDLHPEAVDEVGEALDYFQKRASAEVVNDLDAKINLPYLKLNGIHNVILAGTARSFGNTLFAVFLT